jgi:AAA domain, putative AbiEii toxin, Type IV TA system/AAA domain
VAVDATSEHRDEARAIEYTGEQRSAGRSYTPVEPGKAGMAGPRTGSTRPRPRPWGEVMYIESLRLKNVRTFVDETLEFVHPDQIFRARKGVADNGSPGLPRPRLPNVNLLLGDNGSGKSTVLQAIAMTVLGPSFPSANLEPMDMIRIGRGGDRSNDSGRAMLYAALSLDDQDRFPSKELDVQFHLFRRGEVELGAFVEQEDYLKWWNPVFESNNAVMFAVGYGATRRVEAPERLDMAARAQSRFLRAQRLQSLFHDASSLLPLSNWLPRLQETNRERYTEVDHLLNRLLNPGRYTFTGEQNGRGDYLFERGGLKIPFMALSDGYRAFVGWVGDMLFHACHGCPRGEKLVDLRGIVMVDEIDLHLHPRWQMKVISIIARTFPHLQFILTSHSPLVASSLEWMNIITLKFDKSNSTKGRRLPESIHGLDADQVLLSDFFGLSTTRAPEKASKLDRLTLKARGGDDDAARRLIAELAKGMEESE